LAVTVVPLTVGFSFPPSVKAVEETPLKTIALPPVIA